MTKEVKVISYRDGIGHFIVEVEYDFGAKGTVTIPYGSSEEEIRRILASGYREAYDRFTCRNNVLSFLKKGVIVLSDEDFAKAELSEEVPLQETTPLRTVVETVAEKGRMLVEKAKESLSPKEDIDEDSKEGIPWKIPVEKLRQVLEGEETINMELLKKLSFPWKEGEKSSDSGSGGEGENGVQGGN